MTISGGVSNGIGATNVPYRITDSSSAAFRFVGIDSSNSTKKTPTATILDDATTPVTGVLMQAATAANQELAVAISGIVPIVVNGNSVNIAAGDVIVPTTDGIGVKISTLGATQQFAGGIAQEPATTDGATINILLQPAPHVKGTA